MSNIKCFHCGLVNFATASNCNRCGNSLTITEQSKTNKNEFYGVADVQKIKHEVQAKQSIIYGIGFGLTFLISLILAIYAPTATLMIVFLLGTLIIGFVATWLVASRLENGMTKGEGLISYGVTAREKGTVLLASIIAAIIVFNHEYGYILSPFIIIFCNGAMYLFGRKPDKSQ